MFLEQQISILEWFLNDAETQIFIPEINFIWQLIQIENIYFKL